MKLSQLTWGLLTAILLLGSSTLQSNAETSSSPTLSSASTANADIQAELDDFRNAIKSLEDQLSNTPSSIDFAELSNKFNVLKSTKIKSKETENLFRDPLLELLTKKQENGLNSENEDFIKSLQDVLKEVDQTLTTDDPSKGYGTFGRQTSAALLKYLETKVDPNLNVDNKPKTIDSEIGNHNSALKTSGGYISNDQNVIAYVSLAFALLSLGIH
ncbi:MAG: hypothetical protein WCD18_05415, partial [Thermosynechococcaceae cyanobacterium]